MIQPFDAFEEGKPGLREIITYIRYTVTNLCGLEHFVHMNKAMNV